MDAEQYIGTESTARLSAMTMQLRDDGIPSTALESTPLPDY